MVGSPGSGKSYFVSNKLACHGRMKIISRDILNSWQKCASEVTKCFENASRSVVIDNTNPDIISRKRFIDIANNFNIPCRIFLMNVSKEHALHNNKVSEKNPFLLQFELFSTID